MTDTLDQKQPSKKLGSHRDDCVYQHLQQAIEDYLQWMKEKHKGQVFILDKLICFSNLSIFFFSFLSLSILWAARLQACETPDSLRPKYYPMSFNFSPVYL